MSSQPSINLNRLAAPVESAPAPRGRLSLTPPPPRRAEPVPQRPLTVVTLLRGLRRCWQSAAALGLILGLAFAAFVWVTLPPLRPNAYVKLFLPTGDRGLVYEHPDAALSQQTHKQLLMSRLVLDPTLERAEVRALQSVQEKSDPFTWLSREMNIFFDGPEIVGVRLAGERPEELKVILDTLTQVYLARIANRAADERDKRRTHLERARREANEELKKIQVKLQEDAKAGGSADRQLLVLQHKQITEVMSLAVRRRGEIQNDMQRLSTEQLALKTRNPELISVPQAMIDEELGQEVAVVFIQQQRALSQKKLEEILKRFSPEYEEARNLRAEIEKYDAREAAARAEARPRVEKVLRERILNSSKTRLEQIDSELAAQQKALTGADSEVADLQKTAAALASNLWTVEGSRIELLQAEEKVRAVENSYQKLTVDYNSPPRVSVLEEAIIERVNDSSRRMKMATMAGVAGLGMALLLAAFREYRTYRFSEVDELEPLELPVLGRLPGAAPGALRLALGKLTGSAPVEPTEAVDALRILLAHRLESGRERVLMVTSAVDGEGADRAALELAASFARAGRRVLLIDAQVRRPALHQSFQLPLSPGLGECLEATSSPTEAVRPTPQENLSLLSVGHFGPRAARAMDQGALGGLLAELRDRFELILMRAGGVLSSADALRASGDVDAVLLSVQADRSRLDRTHEARERLVGLGVPILGLVVVG